MTVNQKSTISPQYLRCHCGRYVSKIERRCGPPFNAWYGPAFHDFGTCKIHGEVEIIADGDMFDEPDVLTDGTADK